jgi:hypothetical protein
VRRGVVELEDARILCAMKDDSIPRAPKEYDKARREAEDFYKAVGNVRCPALGGEGVHFTSEGFNHLVYKAGKSVPRNPLVQVMRFELLPKAKLLLETTTTIQEYEEEYRYMPVNRHGRYQQENMLVRAWGFVAIVNRFRLKVVVQQIGNGKKHFYSVIPAWKTRQYRDIKMIETAPTGGVRFEDDAEILKNATNGGVS